MTRILVAAALIAAVLACTPQPGAPVQDMGGRPGTHDCTSIIKCESGCSTAACFTACVTNGSSRGQSEYNASLACAQNVCAGMTGMAARCMLDTVNNRFVDVAGGPTGDCILCIDNAAARMFGVTCSPPSDPYCNPSSCKGVTDTCVND